MVRLLFVLSLLVSFTGIVDAATTRYVDPTCADSTAYVPATRACSGGADISKDTLSEGIAATAAGDILYIRGGTAASPTIYNAAINNTPVNGTAANNRTVISAYPTNRTCSGYAHATVAAWRACYASTYEKVVLQPTTGSASGIITLQGSIGPNVDREHIVFEGFKVSGAGGWTNNGIAMRPAGGIPTNPPACDNGSRGTDTSPSDIVIVNMEIADTRNQGYLGDEYNERIWLLNVWAHHNGRDLSTDHGIYLAGVDIHVDKLLAENNRTFGLHFYSQPATAFGAPGCQPYGTGSIVERSIFRNNRDGILLGRGQRDVTFRNNLVYGNCSPTIGDGQGYGIQINSGGGGSPHQLYNNTTVDNCRQGIFVGANADETIIKNTIYEGLIVESGATGVVNENNYSLCSTCATPAFVNATAGDYRLLVGDARIDAGQNLTGVGVIEDFNGHFRPQGSAHDQGAFEFGGSIVDPPDPPEDPFDFGVESDATEVTIEQGASDLITLTATTVDGTAESVTFSVQGLPTNATVVFDPTSCTPTTPCTTDATIDIANTTPSGTYNLTFRATTATLVRTVPVTLIVFCGGETPPEPPPEPPPETPDFPVFVAAGTFTEGTGAISPPLPAGIEVNDLLLWVTETSNQAITVADGGGGTWGNVTNTPQGIGTAAAAGATRIHVRWSRYNGTQTAPTSSDSGDHQSGRILAFRGVVATGTPWNASTGGTNSVPDGPFNMGGGTTTEPNTLVLILVSASLPDTWATPVNANLANITVLMSDNSTAGNDGGLLVASGEWVDVGAYGSTLITPTNNNNYAYMTIALVP